MWGQQRPRSRSPPRPSQQPRGGDWYCPNCHDHQFGKNLVCRQCGTPRPDDASMCGPPDGATFLKDHVINDEVLNRFLSLTDEQQQVVIARGSLAGARDPSAVLSSRISQVLAGKMTAANPNAKPMGGMGGMGTGDPNTQMMGMMMQMMQMMAGNMAGNPGGAVNMNMNMNADMGKGQGKSQAPRQGDWFCQQCGDHQFAKNALCRNCGAARPTDGSEANPPDAETFLAVHQGLEDHAVQKFRALDPASQLKVIKRGSLNGARDPNAVLLGRIKSVNQFDHSMGTGVPGNGIVPSASDWYCPNCYDLQFKNNDICRICGTSRDLGIRDISSLDASTFLAGHPIDPQAVQQFLQMPPEFQKMVMSGGSLHGARDPTAVLINRMAKARGSAKQAPAGGGGDMQNMMQTMMMQMMQMTKANQGAMS